MDGALTTQPRAPAVPPVRNTSASSMQSPPASADATRVSILSPVFARPGALPRSRRCWTSLGRPRCWANVAGRIRPALATRRWSSKVIWIRSGGRTAWQHLLGAPGHRVGFVFPKPLSPKHRSTLLPIQPAATLIFSVDWGLTHDDSCNRSKHSTNLRVARVLASFDVIAQSIAHENRSPNLGDVLVKHGGSQYLLRMKAVGSTLEITYPEIGRNDVITFPVYDDEISGFRSSFIDLPIEYLAPIHRRDVARPV